jgi:hypothetical protein
MALANINVAVTESNISVDLQNTTVAVSSTTSNVLVGTASSSRFIEDVFDAGTLSGNITLDASNGSIQNITQNGNITGITLNNFSSGQSMTLVITQDSLGGRALDTTTHASNFSAWNFVNDYTQFDTTANHYNILNFFIDGTTIYASLLTEDAPPISNTDLANANIILNNTTTSTNKTLDLGSNTTLSADVITVGSTNKFFTNALADNWFTGKTTSDLTEGTNLYYTTARANSAITAFTGNITAGINTTANITTTADINGNNILATGTLTTNDSLIIPRSGSSNNIIIGGGLSGAAEPGYMSNVNIQNLKRIRFNTPGDDTIWLNADASDNTRSQARGAVVSLLTANIDGLSFDNFSTNTSNINLVIDPNASAGDNRGGALITHKIHNTGNTITGYSTGDTVLSIESVGNIDLNSAGTVATISTTGVHANYFHGDASNMTGLASNTDAVAFIATVPLTVGGNLSVNGNINATGNINYQNVTDLYVTDQKITLNANAATDATVEIIANRPVGGSNTVIRWNETDDKWQFSNDGSAYNDLLTSSASRALVSATDAGGLGSFAYDNGTGAFTYTGPADSDIRGLVSATDAGGLGSFAYNSSTGAFTYTGPSNSEVRSLVDVVTASASGGGTLSYDNSTGDFTFAPADMSGAISNAQAQAFIQANGLAMTANLTSNTNILTTGTGTFDTITMPDGTSGISMTSSSTFDPLTMQQDSSSSIGMDVTFKKSRGGGQANDNDRIVEWNYEIHDGTDFIKPLEAHVYVDSYGSLSRGTGIMPLAWEIHGKTDGNTSTSGTVSMLRVTNDRVIVFNDSGSRGFGTGAGNANITADGTFNTVSSINAQGNITADGNIAAGNILGIHRGSLNTSSNIETTASINATYPDTVLASYVVQSDTSSSGLSVLDITSARSGDAGPQNNYKKATGTIASPGAIGTRDYVQRNLYYGHDGSTYVNTFGTMVYQDSDVGGVSTGNVPLAYEMFTNLAGDSNDGFINSIVRFDSNRNIIFNDTGTRTFGNGQGNANITMDGTINTVANINATGNIQGNYILGDGSQLTKLTRCYKQSFGTVTVSGQTNIQASQANAIFDIAATGDITLATSGNTLTIGGSGSGYGNTQVTNYLASATSVGNVAFTGNLAVESGNTSYSPSAYDGNVSTGNVDRITFSSSPGFYDGQPILFSGTVNSDLTFLNGNVYYVKGAGVSNAYDLYTDAGTTTGLQSGLGSETPNSLAASARNESNNKSDFFGNVNISGGSTLNVDNIKPFTPGGTFSISGLRADDVGLGSGGADFFFPETGGNTEGGILTAHSDRVGTWEDGLRRVSDSSVDIIETKIYRDGSNGTAMDFYKAGGSL